MDGEDMVDRTDIGVGDQELGHASRLFGLRERYGNMCVAGYFLHVRDMRLSRQGSERLRLFRPVGPSPGRFRRAAARCAPQAVAQAR